MKVIFAGISACLPLLGIHTMKTSSPACQMLGKRIAKLATEKHAAAIVLIQAWSGYMEKGAIQAVQSDTDGLAVTGTPALEYGLEATLAYYQRSEIPVVVLEDNPRQAKGGLFKGTMRFRHGLSDSKINATAISLMQHLAGQAQVNQLLETAVARHPSASILSLNAALCDAQKQVCPWALDGRLFYYDDNHLSVTGSLHVYPVLAQHLDQVLNPKSRDGNSSPDGR